MQQTRAPDCSPVVYICLMWEHWYWQGHIFLLLKLLCCTGYLCTSVVFSRKEKKKLWVKMLVLTCTWILTHFFGGSFSAAKNINSYDIYPAVSAGFIFLDATLVAAECPKSASSDPLCNCMYLFHYLWLTYLFIHLQSTSHFRWWQWAWVIAH